MHARAGANLCIQSDRYRRSGSIADRHRQDGRVSDHHISAIPGAAQPRRPYRFDRGPDPRTRRSDRDGRPPAGQASRYSHRQLLRRGGLRQAGAGPGRRRARGDRHAGPSAGLRQAAQAGPAPGRYPGHRRGRPAVRHGIHSRSAPSDPADAGPRRAHYHALQRHPEHPRQVAGVGAHEEPRGDYDYPGTGHGGRDYAGALPRSPRPQAEPAARHSGPASSGATP